MDAGVDDVGIGALFGLYDWKFEVMGLLMHTIDLEEKFGGVGPHTISFPRLQPALIPRFCRIIPIMWMIRPLKKWLRLFVFLLSLEWTCIYRDRECTAFQ